MAQEKYRLSGKRVWVAGHKGMVGSAIVRRLQQEDCNIIFEDRSQLDLRRQVDVEQWISSNKPDAIFVAAATVGGILANDSWPADFLRDNLSIELNIIEAARCYGVEKLLFLGSSCIYPRVTPQPIKESALMTGMLEPTNQWYAVAKIAGVMLCRAYRRQHDCDFISAMPTNLYGPGDNFDLESSHVVPALIAKAHAAKMAGENKITVWGTGTPRREFLYVDDLADALVFLMKCYSEEDHINVGFGSDIKIRELAELIVQSVGAKSQLVFDASKPDGTPQKLLDSSRLLAMGWRPKTQLQDGLRLVYGWYLENVVNQQGPTGWGQ